MYHINNPIKNVQTMATALETEMDNDHSNFSDGVMGSSRPIERKLKKTQKCKYIQHGTGSGYENQIPHTTTTHLYDDPSRQ
jgi:hypothetical protein